MPTTTSVKNYMQLRRKPILKLQIVQLCRIAGSCNPYYKWTANTSLSIVKYRLCSGRTSSCGFSSSPQFANWAIISPIPASPLPG